MTTEPELLPLACGGCGACPSCLGRAVLLWVLLSGKIEQRGEWKGRERYPVVHAGRRSGKSKEIRAMVEEVDAAARSAGETANRALHYGPGTRAMGVDWERRGEGPFMVVEQDEKLGWCADTLPTWGGEVLTFETVEAAEKQLEEWKRQKGEFARPMKVVPYERASWEWGTET